MTATLPQVRQDVLDYLVRMRFNNYERELDFDTPLLEAGVLDSLSMMTVVLFLEQKYGVDFLTVGITRDDFRSIDVLARMLMRSLPLGEPS
jgi:acyl carrier protein